MDPEGTKAGHAGCGSRILRLRRTILLLFWREQFETVCFNSFILKRPLKWRVERLFKSFLARKERVNSHGV
jgi:hypothetical protein